MLTTHCRPAPQESSVTAVVHLVEPVGRVLELALDQVGRCLTELGFMEEVTQYNCIFGKKKRGLN